MNSYAVKKADTWKILFISKTIDTSEILNLPTTQIQSSGTLGKLDKGERAGTKMIKREGWYVPRQIRNCRRFNKLIIQSIRYYGLSIC